MENYTCTVTLKECDRTFNVTIFKHGVHVSCSSFFDREDLQKVEQFISRELATTFPRDWNHLMNVVGRPRFLDVESALVDELGWIIHCHYSSAQTSMEFTGLEMER